MAKKEKTKKKKVLLIVIAAFVATYLLAVIFGFVSNDNYTVSDHSESLSVNTTVDEISNETTNEESPETDSTDSPDDESTAPAETPSTELAEDYNEVPSKVPVDTSSDSEPYEQPVVQADPVIPADSSSAVEPEPTPEPETEPEPEPEPETVETETIEPTQVADPEQAFRDSLSQYNYVGSAESNKYHYPSCRWTDKINDENLIHWDTVEEAQAAGYQACGTCKPK